MDPDFSLLDVVRCHICEAPCPLLHCVNCNIHLCEDCKGKHLSDESKEHKVVPFKYRRSIPKCNKHSAEICDRYCERCNFPVCAVCVSSNEHPAHEVIDILKTLENKNTYLMRDLRELEESVYPKYQDIICNISHHKDNFNRHWRKMKEAINKQEIHFRKQLDIVIDEVKQELDEINSNHLALLNIQEGEIKKNISEITISIAGLKNILHSNDISLVSAYKSRNAEFKATTPKFTVSLQSFTPQKIDKEQIHQQFGSLSASLIKTEDYGYTMNSPDAESYSSDRSLTVEPLIIVNINTDYEHNTLRSLSCLNDEEIWVCGQSSTMRLYNLQSNLLKSIKTKSGYRPRDIVVTKCGDLLYADYRDRTVNTVKDKQIQEIIRLHGWIPRSVCSTSSGDLLVILDNDDEKHSKVVCYSGSLEKHSIQYDEKGQPLYSSGGILKIKYICENRNQNICVSDWFARAIVVVDKIGKSRFTYTGQSSITKGSFEPYGIASDSQGRILAADSNNLCIHILEKDGQFLRYIGNCNLHRMWGICVDSKDYLYVAEDTGIVKKIQYYV